MLNQFTYSQKGWAIIIAMLSFVLFAYEFSFSDTIQMIQQIDEKENKIEWLKEKETELPRLKSKMIEFEKAYSGNDSSSVRDKLTAFISLYAEDKHCIVTEIPLNINYKNSNLKVQTNTFTIKGGYKALLTLLHKLENDFKYVSKTVSAKFYTMREAQSNHKSLYLTIITQSFEQKLN